MSNQDPFQYIVLVGGIENGYQAAGPYTDPKQAEGYAKKVKELGFDATVMLLHPEGDR